MAVYFVYRSEELQPTCLYRRRFDDATVLAWFRRHWVGIEDANEAAEYARRVLGADVAKFCFTFMTIAFEKLRLPEAMQHVAEALDFGDHRCTVYHEGHCVQVLTGIDDSQMAYYFFDDAFLSRHRGLASFLLRDDWRLPDGEGRGGWKASVETVEGPGGDGPGRLYVADLELVHEYLDALDEYPAWHIEGVRVPGLCRWLMGLDDAHEENFGRSMVSLRDALLSGDLAEGDEERAFLLALREDPDDDLTWSAYSDWLAEHGFRPPGYRLLERALPRLTAPNPSRTMDQVGEHVVQSFSAPGDDPRYDHWFIFDDLWGAAHPDLADALLRYATRWDVLSTGNETRHD